MGTDAALDAWSGSTPIIERFKCFNPMQHSPIFITHGPTGVPHFVVVKSLGSSLITQMKSLGTHISEEAAAFPSLRGLFS